MLMLMIHPCITHFTYQLKNILNYASFLKKVNYNTISSPIYYKCYINTKIINPVCTFLNEHTDFYCTTFRKSPSKPIHVHMYLDNPPPPHLLTHPFFSHPTLAETTVKERVTCLMGAYVT